jgi:WD40 repeat protein
MVVVANQGGAVTIADLRRAGAPREIGRHAAAAVEARFSPDGRMVVSADRTGAVHLWPVASDAPAGRELDVQDGIVRCLAFTPDGSAVLGLGDRSVHAWSLRDAPLDRRLPLRGTLLSGHIGTPAFVASDAFSYGLGRCAMRLAPDGQSIVTGGVDRTVRLWAVDYPAASAADGNAPMPNAGPSREETQRAAAAAQLERAVLSPDRHYMAGVTGNAVVVAPLDPVAPPISLAGHPPVLDGAAFDTEGRFLLTIAGGKRRLWQRQGDSWMLRATLDMPPAPFTPAAIAAAGDTVLVGGYNTSVILDMREDPPSVRQFRHPPKQMGTPRMTADGRHVIARDDEERVRVWDITNDRFDMAVVPVRAVAAAPTADGRGIVTVAPDRTVRIWPLPEPLELIRIAREAQTRGLTVGQRIEFGLSIPHDAPADRDQVPPPPR